MGIRIPDTWIPEISEYRIFTNLVNTALVKIQIQSGLEYPFEYRTFWRTVFEWFGFGMVGTKAIALVPTIRRRNYYLHKDSRWWPNVQIWNGIWKPNHLPTEWVWTQFPLPTVLLSALTIWISDYLVWYPDGKGI